MDTIVCVLIVTTIIGLCFPTTRNVGLLSAAVLATIHPIPMILSGLIGIAVWYFKTKGS